MDNHRSSSTHRDIVVVGASAGGIEAAGELVAGLSPELPAAVLVVIHVPPDHPSVMPKLLMKRGPLQASHARDRDPIVAGHVYVAPPGRHLVVMDSHMRLMSTATENLHRPAIDPLFRSAAAAFGPRVIGVVLSGALDDGSAGLQAIKAAGGMTVVQDPTDAAFPSMPESAIANVRVDHMASARELGELITRLAGEEVVAMQPSPQEGRAPTDDQVRHKRVRRENGATAYSCPDCGGVLTEVEEGGLMHFRCRVGHAFSPETLATYQASTVEKALWTALRAMEENAEVWSRLATRAASRGREAMVLRYEERAEHMHEAMDALRGLLLKGSEGDARGLQLPPP